MRYVEVYKWDFKAKKKVFVCFGQFHEWGCDFEEFESGPGNYSTAIVERENGTVENVPVDLIRFTNKEESNANIK